MPVAIRPATAADTEEIASIYAYYVQYTTISFETDIVSKAEMAERIQHTQKTHSWLVAQSDARILGYAYYTAFRNRAAYNHTAESTIYMAPDATRQGVGRLLYHTLIRQAQQQGLRELIGVIALPNPSSTAFHEELGFRCAGILRGIGHKQNQIIDVGLWQRHL
jgi:L-amino acid N-acyltransferase YncA